MNKLQIEDRHLEIVRSILQGENLTVFVFGSRAKGTARPLSDLDLVIKSPTTKGNLASLREKFEDSDLPYKVDLVVWDEITEDFKKQIEKDLLPLG